MRKLGLLCATLLVVLSLGGCWWDVNAAFVKSVDMQCTLILPEYVGDVNADTKLDADSKRIRVQNADQLRSLIDTAAGKTASGGR